MYVFTKNSYGSRIIFKEIVYNNRRTVICSKTKESLKYLKDQNDSCKIMKLKNDYIINYCMNNELKLVEVSEFQCDLNTKREFCKVDTLYESDESI